MFQVCIAAFFVGKLVPCRRIAFFCPPIDAGPALLFLAGESSSQFWLNVTCCLLRVRDSLVSFKFRIFYLNHYDAEVVNHYCPSQSAMLELLCLVGKDLEPHTSHTGDLPALGKILASNSTSILD